MAENQNQSEPQLAPGGRVLVVDDEEVMRDILVDLMEASGHQVEAVDSGEQALERTAAESWDVVLLDLMLPGISGLEALRSIRARDTSLPVIMVTAYATVETALEAMRRGAYDYIQKPFRNQEVQLTVRRALEERRLREENRNLRQRLRGRAGLQRIVGRSPAMRRVFDLVEQVAAARSTVLIQGESGTGKELVARAIHELSPRVEMPFVSVNSGSMPADLLESNLFGHTKGAFTGAVAAKKGLFEVADGGSLFFDEIGTIDLNVQAKLLRVLQEQEFMPLGGTHTVKVDVRIIAATNEDLAAAVEQGRLREDLYYRINVIRITLPPLRERRDDIAALTDHFLRSYAQENAKQVRRVTPAALRWLEQRDWPGNVRQLENAIQRAVVLSRGEEVDVDLLEDEEIAPPRSRSTASLSPNLDYREQVESFERELLSEALRRAEGVQKRAAELLGLSPSTLNEKLKRLGLRR